MTIEKSPYIIQRDVCPSVERLLQVFSDVFYVKTKLVGMSSCYAFALKIQHQLVF